MPSHVFTLAAYITACARAHALAPRMTTQVQILLWCSSTNDFHHFRYTLSKTSPLNTTLSDPGGAIAYEVSTPFKLGNSETIIKRGNQIVATIQWKIFHKDTITMDGRTTTINEVFPRSKKLSTSRVYTMPSGEQFKWKDTSKLYCVSVDTGLNLATYYRTLFHALRSKKSTLDILHGADTRLTDALVVTWVIAEKKARERRRARRNAAGGGGGGGGGGG
ncbi:hypothetical protein CTheo_5074 [Ceratobasidium theobromae]|uniref:DUF6593 domain-containing protein n=1 Tax=Ceratobasidium theobromae TaxID=1582974 RepID=A0A5N5QIA3_9AGAM|nr:hypothetical protein CTheo_5074 [Ceratobasidium theobromae]